MSKDFNHPQIVASYDQHIRQLIPDYETMHQQVKAILKATMPDHAQILIIGCGTGHELRELLNVNHTWHFTAIDVSENMLDQARKNIAPLNENSRVQFVLGDASVLAASAKFHSILVLLVAHFIEFTAKLPFFQILNQHCLRQAILLTYDLMQMAQPALWQALPYLCQSNGLSQKQTDTMMTRLPQDFFLVNEQEYCDILQQAGFNETYCFSQALTYQGFIAKNFD